MTKNNHEGIIMIGKTKNYIINSAEDEVLNIDKGTEEKTVPLYIKFNKLENCFVIVISFHEQKYPLTYYFK